MKIINTKDENFAQEFNDILGRAKVDIKKVSSIVNGIIDDIVENGNKAVCEHVSKFDNWSPKSGEDLLIDVKDMEDAYNNIDEKLKQSLHLAYDRIKLYHEKQLPKSWIDFEDNGTILGQKVTAVDRAGLYIPGGKAAYPSSLLMNAIPAIVAGVEEIVVCTPTPDIWKRDTPYYLESEYKGGIVKQKNLIYYQYDNNKYPHAGAGIRVQF